MEDVLLRKVRDFADAAHGTQMRKYTPERYIVHPVRVMETVRSYSNKLPMLAAALLHDVLEDTPVSKEEMLQFLKEIMTLADAEETVRLVIELTDVFVKENFPKLNRKQRKQKEAERIAETSADAQTIKYADILDNCTEISLLNPGFAPRYLRECLAILNVADKGDPELYAQTLNVVKKNLAHLN
ncbi:MAG: HD domain-containing protein [Flavobacterium sp.]|nr:MAG: HD domain-containing protein [Flavobacterium sp.]